MIFILISTIIVLAVTVSYVRQLNSRFSKYGIKYDYPIPILGNYAKTLLRLSHVGNSVVKLYNKFPEERFVGRFDGGNEAVIIRDIDLVKMITVKDFDHFTDHRSIFTDSNSAFARNIFSLKGQDWRDMRSVLGPAFTSFKIRAMVPFMVDVGDKMFAMLNKKLAESKTGYVDIDCKDMCSRYASDVLASCVFALDVNSYEDLNNEFYLRGLEASAFDFKQMVIFFIMYNVPKLAKFLDIDWPCKKAQNFFRSVVKNGIKEREQSQTYRPDLIQILMEAKKGKKKQETTKTNGKLAESVKTNGQLEESVKTNGKFEESVKNTNGMVDDFVNESKGVARVWEDKDLIAQGMIFVVAGLETVSDAMCFLLYELAINPDIQDRLAKEIREHDVKNKGKYDFNTIQEMPYLEMVVTELLRLWPPATSLDRVCVKDYNMGKPNKKSKEDFIILKDTTVVVPIYAFHRDPKYYPNPSKFDPERFSEENRHKINPYSYIPFGIGPRNCNGFRMALVEMKIIAYQLLLKLEVLPSDSTRVPAELIPGSNNNRLKHGNVLRFKPRA